MLGEFLKRVFGELVDDWKSAWRWASVRALLVFTVLATYFTENREQWDTLVSFLPDTVKPLAPIVIGLAVFYLRVRKQKTPE
jgi:hypothetical protein